MATTARKRGIKFVDLRLAERYESPQQAQAEQFWSVINTIGGVSEVCSLPEMESRRASQNEEEENETHSTVNTLSKHNVCSKIKPAKKKKKLKFAQIICPPSPDIIIPEAPLVSKSKRSGEMPLFHHSKFCSVLPGKGAIPIPPFLQRTVKAQDPRIIRYGAKQIIPRLGPSLLKRVARANKQAETNVISKWSTDLSTVELDTIEKQFLNSTSGRHYIMISEIGNLRVRLGGNILKKSHLNLKFNNYNTYLTILDVVACMFPMVPAHKVLQWFNSFSRFHSTSVVFKKYPPHIVGDIMLIFNQLDNDRAGYLTHDSLKKCIPSADLTDADVARLISESNRYIARSRVKESVLSFAAFAEMIKYQYRPCNSNAFFAKRSAPVAVGEMLSSQY